MKSNNQEKSIGQFILLLVGICDIDTNLQQIKNLKKKRKNKQKKILRRNTKENKK